MTTSNSTGPRTTWTAVRPNVWRDSSTISSTRATEMMASKLYEAGLDTAVTKVGRKTRKNK